MKYWSFSTKQLLSALLYKLTRIFKNPVIGHFPFKADHDPMVQSYTYVVPLSNFEDCLNPEEGDPTCLIMATHATVNIVDNGGEVVGESETAWQECTDKTRRCCCCCCCGCYPFAFWQCVEHEPLPSRHEWSWPWGSSTHKAYDSWTRRTLGQSSCPSTWRSREH